MRACTGVEWFPDESTVHALVQYVHPHVPHFVLVKARNSFMSCSLARYLNGLHCVRDYSDYASQ